MTDRELQDYVEWLGVPRKDLAEYLGVDYRTMSRWLSGEYPVPRMLEIIIKAGAIRVEDIEEKVTKRKIV
jgi:transcriptional regulator with XRE-family HTH domain